MDLLWFYKKAMRGATPLLRGYLSRRVKSGKEDPDRLRERMGEASLPRPAGPLIWLHAASVGEAQSMLVLINLILDQNPHLHVLVTSVTRTSAQILADRLPDRAFHQFSPVDHPDWIRKFLDHWKPDIVLWAESELWPNTLSLLKKRHIPAALLNARLSEKSFMRWRKIRSQISDLLSVFTVILAQTRQDEIHFQALGARSVVVTDNIKYSAKPLDVDAKDLDDLRAAVGNRPCWVYASTHAGEEELAAQIHREMAEKLPGLLTIIVPRHPARRDDIAGAISQTGLSYRLRGEAKSMPQQEDHIYIADTMGELGLFYKLAPLAIIGRSFSDDGGGGHNPIEAALLDCAVFHGPNIQNQQQIFDDMADANVAVLIETKDDAAKILLSYLENPEKLQSLRSEGAKFAKLKSEVLSRVVEELEPLFLNANLPVLKASA